MAERTPNPGNCTWKGTCFTPGSKARKPPKFCFDLIDQPVEYLVQAQILLDPELLGQRQIQNQPLFPLMGSKGIPGVDRDCVGATRCADDSQPAFEALPAGCGASPEHAVPARAKRWHPHGGNEISRKPPGQFNRIPRVRLHPRSGDQLHCLRMSNDHFCDQRL